MEDVFAQLVKDAICFLDQSIQDIESGQAKYAEIHFYCGLELFLKAVLFREHWSLVVRDVNQSSRERISAGDFESVGLKEALCRLKNLLNYEVGDRERHVYEKLRRRRNQAIHFFHTPEQESPKRSAVQHLAAWKFLFDRLTGAWKECELTKDMLK